MLQDLVSAVRSNLRSCDPIVRFGGDEFVCGLGGVDLADAQNWFAMIDRSIRHTAGVGISVGLAALGIDETLEQLTGRADTMLLEAKRSRGA